MLVTANLCYRSADWTKLPIIGVVRTAGVNTHRGSVLPGLTPEPGRCRVTGCAPLRSRT